MDPTVSLDEMEGEDGNYSTTNTMVDVAAGGSGSGSGSSANAGRKRGFSGATPLVRRKRATIACQFCRLRKTKCDNVRPVCGFCRYHQARCIYPDAPPEEGPGTGVVFPAPVEDVSDIQHRQLLSRLDRIDERLQALQENSSNVVSVERLEPPRHGLLVASPVPASFSYTPPSTASLDPSIFGSRSQGQEQTSTKTRIFFSPSTRSEAPLKWPIFKGFLSEKQAGVTSFLLEPPIPEIQNVQRSGLIAPSDPLNTHSSGARNHHVGIHDEAFVPLCRKFLTHVHTKNPILDGSLLEAYAMDCTEHGPKWDAPSCLVLLACALACYTVPWTPPVIHNPTPETVDMHFPNNNSIEDADAASAYYFAAKKRIGLLGSSLLDIQCLFFASIYEKYIFHTLQSWFYLQQAATRLRVHHLQRGETSLETDDHIKASGKLTPNENHLEERIFWAIFKAESDMLPELQLTPTDLQQFDYPNGFPYPPESLTSDAQSPVPPPEGSLTRHSEERSWFFYLAELSVRRTINDVLPAFYGKGEEHWVTDIDLVCHQFDEFDKQMYLWTSCLPSSIQFNDIQQPDNELVYYLQGRLEEWREWIHRPLLYYYLHRPPDAASPTARVLELARQEVQICAKLIGRVRSHGRHGGTWLLVRRAWRCAVVILAVVIRGGEVEPPPNWRELVRMALATLARWSPGSPDLRSMGLVLEALFRTVCERLDRPTLS